MNREGTLPIIGDSEQALKELIGNPYRDDMRVRLQMAQHPFDIVDIKEAGERLKQYNVEPPKKKRKRR